VWGRQILPDRTLGPIQQISVGNGGFPKLAVADDGTDVIIWGSPAGLAIRTRSQSGVLGPVQTVSPTGSSYYADLALTPGGDAIIARNDNGVISGRGFTPPG